MSSLLRQRERQMYTSPSLNAFSLSQLEERSNGHRWVRCCGRSND